MNEKTQKNYKTGSLLFIGSMFIGMGIGMYFGETTVGVMIGMGIGFLAMGIFTIINGKKESNNQ